MTNRITQGYTNRKSAELEMTKDILILQTLIDYHMGYVLSPRPSPKGTVFLRSLNPQTSHGRDIAIRKEN